MGQGRSPHHQEGDEKGEGELGEDVPQLKRELSRADAIERPTEKEQKAGALKSVAKSCRPAVSAFPTLAEGERHGDADDEHEKRLDEVPKAQSVPGVMMKLGPDGMNNGSLKGRINQMFIDMSGFRDQQNMVKPRKKSSDFNRPSEVKI